MKLHGVTQGGRTKQVLRSHSPQYLYAGWSWQLCLITFCVLQDALQALVGLQLLHPSTVSVCQVTQPSAEALHSLHTVHCPLDHCCLACTLA